MCGIWCCISEECTVTSPNAVAKRTPNTCVVCAEQDAPKNITCRQQEILSRRGPNLTFQRCFEIENGSDSVFVHLSSHVLWTQGKEAVPQPYVDSTGSKFMLFNGDIYSFNGFGETSSEALNSSNINSRAGDILDYDDITNDGLLLFQKLASCTDSPANMCNILGNLQGPFAFILVDKSENKVWFARDFFGRESLLFNYESDSHNHGRATSWNISSVSVLSKVVEVPTSGLFCVDLQTKELQLFPYSRARKNISNLERDFISVINSVGITPTATYPNHNGISIDLHFSSLLKLPEQDDIEDRAELASLIKLAECKNSVEDFMKHSVNIIDKHIKSFLQHLRKSVKHRVSTLPPYCKNCIKAQVGSSTLQICEHAKVGVLFSGGLDSTVLAYLAAESLPKGSKLDLINVAFSRDENFSNVPDRETAEASYRMLKDRFEPEGIEINLVLVNVNKTEVEEYRRSRIRDLISPLRSVLDDSLGICLWFAARGQGQLYSDPEQHRYISPVRVVLLGSGADELLGGYGRHRSAYEKLGWEGLASEMQLEIDRISIRNLGRDNRIVSDHGICPRMPFLDESVVHFLTRECSLWVKCCPVNVGALGARGCGEKLLLRVTAVKLFGDSYLSLALFPKRAMQFGSRIAKLENSKEKGGDSCQRLL